MSETLFAPETRVQSPDESILRRIDFTSVLLSGETLTGTPTVTSSPLGPVLTEKAVNSVAYTDRQGNTVAIGKAVLVRVAGVTDDTQYVLTATCATSAGNTRQGKCRLNGVDS